MNRQQRIEIRDRLLAELKQIDRELKTCLCCEHILSNDYCTKFQAKLDAAAIEAGPRECPEFVEDPIPF